MISQGTGRREAVEYIDDDDEDDDIDDDEDHNADIHQQPPQKPSVRTILEENLHTEWTPKTHVL